MKFYFIFSSEIDIRCPRPYSQTHIRFTLILLRSRLYTTFLYLVPKLLETPELKKKKHTKRMLSWDRCSLWRISTDFFWVFPENWDSINRRESRSSFCSLLWTSYGLQFEKQFSILFFILSKYNIICVSVYYYIIYSSFFFVCVSPSTKHEIQFNRHRYALKNW